MEQQQVESFEMEEAAKQFINNAPEGDVFDNPNVEYIDPEEVNKEYAEIVGEDNLDDEDINKTGLKDTTFEALVTDPNFILTDFRRVCEKNEVDFVAILNEIGFTAETFKAMLVNKSITEQIYTLLRELAIVVYKMGTSSDPVVNTLNIRTMMGDMESSKEFLEFMDRIYLPYVKEFLDNGTLDDDWFTKFEGELDPEDKMGIRLAHTIITQVEQNREVRTMEEELDTQNVQLETTLEEIETAVQESVQEGEVFVTNGDEDVAVVTETEAEEALQEVAADGSVDVLEANESAETESN